MRKIKFPYVRRWQGLKLFIEWRVYLWLTSGQKGGMYARNTESVIN